MNQQTDEDLVSDSRNGDMAAFEELVMRYQNRVVAILAHLTRRHEQAEDLAQEVFLRVYRARKRYTPDANGDSRRSAVKLSCVRH